METANAGASTGTGAGGTGSPGGDGGVGGVGAQPEADPAEQEAPVWHRPRDESPRSVLQS